MKKTKIDWCDCTINPVVGCPRGCEYCYGRKMNTRYKFVPDWDKPQFFPDRLKALRSKSPKSIFMDSMSDFVFWKEEWMEEVADAVHDNPQHKYIFLSKTKVDFETSPINVYYGQTVTTQAMANDIGAGAVFLSIEPILEPLRILDFKNVGQVIIGAETGNRKGKVKPEKAWIDAIVRDCRERGVRVFMKESLRSIMGADFIQDELMWRASR